MRGSLEDHSEQCKFGQKPCLQRGCHWQSEGGCWRGEQTSCYVVKRVVIGTGLQQPHCTCVSQPQWLIQFVPNECQKHLFSHHATPCISFIASTPIFQQSKWQNPSTASDGNRNTVAGWHKPSVGPIQEKLDRGQLQNRQLLGSGTGFKGYVHHILAQPPVDDVLLPFENVNSLNREASPRITEEFAELMHQW